MYCPKCGKCLVEYKTYPCLREDGFEYGRLEYTCSFDGTRMPFGGPEYLAAEERHAEFRANYANDLRVKVENRHSLAKQLLKASNKETTELEEQIRDIEERLASSKQYLEKERSQLISYLNKNTQDLLKLESESKNALTEAEIKGLELYEDESKKKLLRVESLLAIISAE